MGMTNNNLCDSCTNIGCEFQSGIVRTKCAFYIPPHVESDNCGNYVVMQPTVETIERDYCPRCQYYIDKQFIYKDENIQMEMGTVKDCKFHTNTSWICDFKEVINGNVD